MKEILFLNCDDINEQKLNFYNAVQNELKMSGYTLFCLSTVEVVNSTFEVLIVKYANLKKSDELEFDELIFYLVKKILITGKT